MRHRYIQQSDGSLMEVSADWSPDPEGGLIVMGDIEPYRSTIDGSVITSRSKHRAHLRQHGCIEVGNDSSLTRKPQPLKSPPGLKEKIIRAYNQVEERERNKSCR